MEKLVGTVDTQSRPEQPTTPAGGASEAEEEDADDAYDPEDMSDMSDEGEDSDDEAPDFYGYDMATGKCLQSCDSPIYEDPGLHHFCFCLLSINLSWQTPW